MRWKKDCKEFEVSVNYHETRGAQCSFPKPVYEILGKPKKIKFIIRDDSRIVEIIGKSTV